MTIPTGYFRVPLTDKDRPLQLIHTPSGTLAGIVDGRGQDQLMLHQSDDGAAVVSGDGTLFSVGVDNPQPVTAAGTFTGNGATQSINVGFEPDFLLIKSSAAASAVMQTRLSWHRRSDSLINQESIGDASTAVGADTGAGVTITSTGFDVGANTRVNGNTATIYWFAYRDQGSLDFVQSSYAGNGVTGRTVDVLEGRRMSAVMVKRDYTPAPVWMFPGQSAWYWNGSAMVASTGTSLSADGTNIVTGLGNEINGWSGALGEAMGLYGWPADGRSTFAITYTGNGQSSRRINLPWELEAFIIVPLNATVANAGRMWISGIASGSHAPLGAGAVTSDSAVITTVSENTVVIGTNTTVNQNGQLYGLLAWRKCRGVGIYDTRRRTTVYTKAIQCASSAYIDCGADSSLDISGALTMEFFGSPHPPSTTPMSGGAGVDTEGSKQSPIMFRSLGNDGSAGAVSYGMELCAPTAHDSSALSRGASILVHTRGDGVWTLPQDGLMANLDPYPMNTGFVIGGRIPQHIVVTHDGGGTRRVYVDGVQVKERKRNLSGTYGSNGTAVAGHKLVFGGRQEAASVTDANGHSFRMARIYRRELSPAEVRKNWQSIYGVADAVPDYVEMWDARDAVGTTLPAKLRSANNGTITGTATIDGL